VKRPANYISRLLKPLRNTRDADRGWACRGGKRSRIR
jgi:hypothetical protein